MKKLSVLGIVVGAALLSVAPASIQPSSRNVVELSVNKAEALVYRRHYRRAYRRAYRNAYYGGYGYGYRGYGYGYGGYGYPGYGGYYGYGYPAAVIPLGIRGRWGGWGGWGGWPWW